jgi:16S rRNA (guanine527-N7)-methyltransferase
VKHPDPRLVAYRDLLIAAPVSVTSVREPAAAWTLHVEDALAAVHVLERLAPATVVDVGSGGGSPGIPIALACGVPVTLLEATAAKCAFLRGVVGALGARCTVVHDRSEGFARGDGRDAFDLVTGRALAPPPAAAELCLPLARPGGHVLLWTGGVDVGAVAVVAERVAAAVIETIAVAENRNLVLLAKGGPTPERYPRRPGMATARPLSRVRSRP